MKIFRASLLLLVFASGAFAQAPTTGFPSYGSFEEGINRQNLNVNIAIPIVSVPGRGTNLVHGLVYDSSIWKKVAVGVGTYAWSPVDDPWDTSDTPNWGWKRTNPIGILAYTKVWDIVCTTEDQTGGSTDHYSWYYSNYSITEPNGTKHKFGVQVVSPWPTLSCGTNPNPPRTDTANDGSGYWLDATTLNSPFVLSISGTKFTTTKMTDTNGNYNSSSVSGTVTTWTDTAGHAALKVDNVSTTSVLYKYQDTSGTYQTISMTLTSVNIKTNFACSGVSEYTSNGIYLPTQITLPNNQSYSITYEQTPSQSGYVTGRVKRVTLPTGGYYEYQYPGDPVSTTHNGISCSDGSVVSMTRVVSAGEQNPPQWVFSRSQVGSDWKTTVTPPILPYDSTANVSTYLFNSSGQITSEKHYQGSATGTPLRTINTSWAANGTPSSTVLILEDGSTQTKTDTTIDNYGNLTQSIEYAWGASAAVRTTQITYLSTSSYTAKNIRNRPTQILVRDGGTNGTVKSRTDVTYDDSGYINTACPTGVAQHDDTNYGCTFSVRGLPTSSKSYATASVPSGDVTSHFFYDFFGNLSKTDVNGTQQQLLAYSSATVYAYPDTITNGPSNGPQLTSSATYNSFTGKAASSTDENGQVASFTYDAMKRLLTITRQDGAVINYAYDDPNHITRVTTPVQGTLPNPADKIVRKTQFDPLGRAYSQVMLNGGESITYSAIDFQFDTFGRVYRKSNPYTGAPQYWTETWLDALGRVRQVKDQDNSVTSYTYSLSTITVIDPTNRQRKTDTDAVGRIVKVSEPDVNNNNALTVDTTYAFSVFDDPKTVTQGVQTRTYNYDDLGRLTSQTTPEAGTWSYQYNAVGLVTQRTDARGVITTYSYDTLNRPSSVSYSVGSTGVPATATVSYAYGTNPASNNNGRLITVTDGVGSEGYTYDILGQVTQVQKVINGTTYATGYEYNLAGELAKVTYPSGRQVQHSFDAAGRLATIASGGTIFADTFGYNTAGLVTGFNLGNGVIATFSYSPDRLQLTSLSYVKNTTTLLSLAYNFGSAGSNNDLILGITDNTGTQEAGRSATYTYDALYRLKTAVTTGSTTYPQWGLSWTYDRYGNRTAQTVTAGSAPPNSLSFANPGGAQTNRPDNYAHDANGNMTNDGLNQLGYDAENHLVSAAGAAYTYDGTGLRVKKVSGATTTLYIFSGAKVLAEYENGAAVGSPTREYVYSGGALLAKVESGATNYYLQDLLSNRVITNSSGGIVTQSGHFPFGENWFESGSPTKLKFTSYERDSESGNDCAMARFDVNRLGRFSSPDPIAGLIADPQSLNRYAYVSNNPIMLLDPLGLQSCSLKVKSNNPLTQETKTTLNVIFNEIQINLIFVTGDQAAQLVVQTNADLPPGFLGYDQPGSNVAQIDNQEFQNKKNEIAGQYGSLLGPIDINLAMGIVIAHEFGHYLLGQGHPQVGNFGLMRPGTDQGIGPFLMRMPKGPQGVYFSPDQGKAIRAKCGALNNPPAKKQRPGPKGPSAVQGATGRWAWFMFAYIGWVDPEHVWFFVGWAVTDVGPVYVPKPRSSN